MTPLLREPPQSPGFWVLLGADYCGKSSVMSALAERTGWPLASYDDGFLDDGSALVARLRDDAFPAALRGAGDPYSADFVLTILQSAVVFLRGQALRGCASRPVVVDSYYYKILAKCRLSGLINETFFDWWRSFPAPRGVIYLEVTPTAAWRRAGHGAAVNRFEHYGPRPTRTAFTRFQRDLRRAMLAEARGVPTYPLAAGLGVAEAARAVEDIVRREHGWGLGAGGAASRVTPCALPA